MGKVITICYICQGGNKYEPMANILSITTRFYNPDIKIVVGIPTPFDIYTEPNSNTYELLKKLNIQYVYTENYVSHDYKIANKLGLLDKINNEIETDYILFLDTDIICVGRLEPTLEMYNSDISGVFTDYGDRPNKNDGIYWKNLHDKLQIDYNIPKKPIGYSLFSKSTMWAPYLCAGYIFMKKNPIVSKTLNEICYKLYNEIGGAFKIPNNWGGVAAPDQQAIALTINKLKLTYNLLDHTHVYSLIPGHYLPTNKNTYSKLYNSEKKPTHMNPIYRNRIHTIEKICCKYCYDSFMSDQQFVHYHKPTRIFEFFFGQGLEKILKSINDYNYIDLDNIDTYNKFIISKNICRRSIDEAIFPNKLYKELLTEISKTKYEDWSHSVHGVSQEKKKVIKKKKKKSHLSCLLYVSCGS